MKLGLALLAAALVLAGTAVHAQEKVTFGLDRSAQPEFAGYYQAIAKGIYLRRGLDVTLRQGGPAMNAVQMLTSGRLDFAIAPDSYTVLNFVRDKQPYRAIAAMFQKDSSVLLAHPDVGHDAFPQLKSVPIMVTPQTQAGIWNFLRAKYGYNAAQIRPYDGTLKPFLADKMAVQQGFLGLEPILVTQQGGFEPVVLLEADSGFLGYGQLLVTSEKLSRGRPDLMRKFVNASIEGWYSYLYADGRPGEALIKKENPAITDEILAYGKDALMRNGILESGDGERDGIGAMTDARWAAFGRTVKQPGMYPVDLDVSKAYTTEFVDKRVGVAIKKRS